MIRSIPLSYLHTWLRIKTKLAWLCPNIKIFLAALSIWLVNKFISLFNMNRNVKTNCVFTGSCYNISWPGTIYWLPEVIKGVTRMLYISFLFLFLFGPRVIFGCSDYSSWSFALYNSFTMIWSFEVEKEKESVSCELRLCFHTITFVIT